MKLQVRSGSYDAAKVVGFLRVLLRKISGKLLLIWDGSPIHRGQAVKDFLKGGATKRLHLEQLPGYAPDLNHDEGIWNYLKRVELGNVCCSDFKHLTATLIRARERLRHKREIIRPIAFWLNVRTRGPRSSICVRSTMTAPSEMRMKME